MVWEVWYLAGPLIGSCWLSVSFPSFMVDLCEMWESYVYTECWEKICQHTVSLSLLLPRCTGRDDLASVNPSWSASQPPPHIFKLLDWTNGGCMKTANAMWSPAQHLHTILLYCTYSNHYCVDIGKINITVLYCSLSLWRVVRGSKHMFLELIHGLFIT